MHVVIDVERCQLHGECLLAAPEVFEIRDEQDTVFVKHPHLDESVHDAVRNAVLMCPMSAITIEE